ncbi:phage tail protein [Kitasatospora sp. NPDC001664]
MSGGAVRGALSGLGTPHPIAGQLPAVYGENEFLHRFTEALDGVLAPVFATLDNLPAYFDPALAPADFVRSLAHWVGAALPAEPRRQREAVRRAVGLHALRGTPAGLADRVELHFGVRPEIEESGGAAWSAVPGGALPGTVEGRLVVRLRLPEGAAAVDAAAVLELVRAECPAHLRPRVEVLTGDDGSGRST